MTTMLKRSFSETIGVAHDDNKERVQESKDVSTVSDGQVDVELVRRKRLCRFDPPIRPKRSTRIRSTQTLNNTTNRSKLATSVSSLGPTMLVGSQTLSTPTQKLEKPVGVGAASRCVEDPNGLNLQRAIELSIKVASCEAQAASQDALVLQRTIERSIRTASYETRALSQALERSIETNKAESAQRSYFDAMNSVELNFDEFEVQDNVEVPAKAEVESEGAQLRRAIANSLTEFDNQVSVKANVGVEINDEDALLRRAIANSLQDLAPAHSRRPALRSSRLGAAANCSREAVGFVAKDKTSGAKMQQVSETSSKSAIIWI